MPRKESRTFTDKHKEQVKKFLQALLDYQNHEKIEAEWQTGHPEPYHYHLVVNNITKSDLARIIYGGYENNKDLERKKRYIQTAIAYLTDLKILVRKSDKIGYAARILKFHLQLTSQDPKEILDSIFADKWVEERKKALSNSSPTNSVNGDIRVTIGVEEVEQETETISYSIKIESDMGAIRQNLEQVRQMVMEITQDPRNKIMGTKKGCVNIEFEGSLEGFEILENKIKSGELTEIFGFPILELKKIFQLTEWFDNITINDWDYDTALQGSLQARRLVQQLNNDMRVAVFRDHPAAGKNNPLDNIVSQLPVEWLAEMGLDPSQIFSNQILQILKDLLNSSNLDCIKFIALELVDLTNVPEEVIDTLANRIPIITDSETRWQLALTLGKLNPEHPLGAVAQSKRIQLDSNRLKLFLALRIGEDDLIDVFLQVYPRRKDYLPVGLQLFLLDEAEEVFSQVEANEEERYLSLEFTAGISEIFSIKFSLGNNELVENFVI